MQLTSQIFNEFSSWLLSEKCFILFYTLLKIFKIHDYHDIAEFTTFLMTIMTEWLAALDISNRKHRIYAYNTAACAETSGGQVSYKKVRHGSKVTISYTYCHSFTPANVSLFYSACEKIILPSGSIDITVTDACMHFHAVST